ncbi:MCE family protein [Nocardioides dubius]|uniref:Mce/MlaD domain-containing protein n=1 Tax=Nocardioides dubius TaxID=317019 RepID=A0ABN1TXU5_9ACTN
MTLLSPRLLRLLLIGALLAALVAVVIALLPDGERYQARLAHAGGLRAGDAVRIAGLDVGSVTSVRAERDQVAVEFRLDADARLTRDTKVEVKLESLLGKRFLALTPGTGATLDAGGTLPVTNASDPWTIEEFWLESAPKLEELDLDSLERSIDVLSSELDTAPRDVRTALDGLTGLSGMVNRRDAQLQQLLATTRSVTTTVTDQTDELEALMSDADKVLTMVYERREALRVLLRDSRRLAGRLTALARTTQPDLEPALRRIRTVLGVLNTQRKELDTVLEMAGPTMRLYTNAAGDGPWLGVNAPWFVLPDDLWCVATPGACS